MKVRAVVLIADEIQGGEEILTKESLNIKKYMLNPIVLQDFNINLAPIGKTTNLTWEGNQLIADIELKPEANVFFQKAYPSIGYSSKDGELMSIALCPLGNLDKRIKTLEEQMGN